LWDTFKKITVFFEEFMQLGSYQVILDDSEINENGGKYATNVL
jgi:hypothetical protein